MIPGGTQQLMKNSNQITFLVPHYYSKLIKDVRRNYGVTSDCCALLLKLDINKGKKRNDEKKKDVKKGSK
jgi:hypothetical protein